MKLIVRQLVFFICMTYWYFTNLSSKERTEGCLSMRFKDDWNLDSFVDFNFYVENLHNQSIVSRRWLISKILEELATSEKGIILTAKMGYGKSSIVSNIVCAEHTSDWYAIRKHVLAYHFCRYDSIRSKNPAYLIRNIASAIVNRYPELGNFILSDDIAHGILYGLRCEIDPISCLEIAILNPLRNKWKNYQFVIVIDALDECNSGNKHDILQLLFTELDSFPPKKKFIFTSRNIEEVVSKLKYMNSIQLDTFINANINDTAQYIRQTSLLTEAQIHLLTSVAKGNFLHVKYYLQSCQKFNDCDFTYMPSSLEKNYRTNFERAFEGKYSLYEELRPIVEVLCTMTKPMTEDEIFEVANISSENRRNMERVIGNELGHFLVYTSGYMSFLHKSIADFLTCISGKHLWFYVHREHGHKLFGAYLLKSFNITKTDIVEVVYHVAMSENLDLQSILVLKYEQQIQKDTKLHISYNSQKHDEAVKYFNYYYSMHIFFNKKRRRDMDTGIRLKHVGRFYKRRK